MGATSALRPQDLRGLRGKSYQIALNKPGNAVGAVHRLHVTTFLQLFKAHVSIL
jgi:hypothetical protein